MNIWLIWTHWLWTNPQNEGQTDTDSTEFDAKLLQVETNLSFNSLRAKLVADFEALNEEGFATLEAIPAEHFVPSSSLRSILNEQLEAKITNSIFVYYNQDWLIEITNGDIETRDAIRELRKNFPNTVGGKVTQNGGVYSVHAIRHNNQNCSVTRNFQFCS